MPNLDLQWFNDIYASGDKPSLEQRAELSGQIQFHFPNRTIRDIEEQLKQCLFEFGKAGGYSKGLQALTYDLLIGILPKTGIEPERLNKYITEYRKALAKHSRESSLTANFS